jgi:hypothetical protein
VALVAKLVEQTDMAVWLLVLVGLLGPHLVGQPTPLVPTEQPETPGVSVAEAPMVVEAPRI